MAENKEQTYWIAPAKFSQIYIVWVTWFILGGFYDEYYHYRFGVEIESFFTPSHYLLYSGFLAITSFTGINMIVNHATIPDWKKTLPPGYNVTVLGIIVFSIGGGVDFIWHMILGFEGQVEALYSPPHLLLGVSAAMMYISPLKHAFHQKLDLSSLPFLTSLPYVLSITYFFSNITFFTAFNHPYAKPWATEVPTPEYATVSKVAGVTSLLFFSLVLVGIILFLVLAFERLPSGIFFQLIAINAVLSIFVGSTWYLIGFAIAGAVDVELMYQFGAARKRNAIRIQVFCIFTPILIHSIYFAGLFLVSEVWWEIHLWTGSIVLSGLLGYLMSLISYLMFQENKE